MLKFGFGYFSQKKMRNESYREAEAELYNDTTIPRGPLCNLDERNTT